MRRLARMGLFVLLFLGFLPLAVPATAAPINKSYIPDQIIVAFANGYHLASNGTLYQGSVALKRGLGIGPITKATTLTSTGSYSLVQLPTGSDVDSLIAQLNQTTGVRFAERNVVRKMAVTPNDPLFNRQWGMTKIGADGTWNLTTGNSVVIAIVDTGVSSTHPDLAGRVLPGYNAFENNNNSADDQGHGTAMAGIAAASGNNNEGVAGMCWSCLILPVKVLNSDGEGSSASVVGGMAWAADNGARIISMSLGGDTVSRAEREVVEYIHNKGIPLFASSGNSGNLGNPVIYPAALPNVIAIGASTTNDGIARFSSFGDYVDLAAPGVNIWTTFWDNGDTYGAGSGTSPACPFVSGLAALMVSAWPELTTDQIEKILTRTAVDIMDPGKDVYSGYGRINAYAAVEQAVLHQIPGEGPIPPIPAGNPAFVPIAAPNPPIAGVDYFVETGHTLRGEFKNYWERNGGLAVFGYPLSEEFVEETPDGSFTVQYFERQRFEWHPEKVAPYNILLGRLGDALLKDRGDDWFNFPKGQTQPGCQYFPETQHTICGEFLNYWRTHGLADPALDSFGRSLQLFGYPISEPVTETNRDGATVTTQWFERARFEYHDGKGVLLGLLAKEYADNRGWR